MLRFFLKNSFYILATCWKTFVRRLGDLKQNYRNLASFGLFFFTKNPLYVLNSYFSGQKNVKILPPLPKKKNP
jgi:hypothetical protein